jgi:hypothetical protein
MACGARPAGGEGRTTGTAHPTGLIDTTDAPASFFDGH